MKHLFTCSCDNTDRKPDEHKKHLEEIHKLKKEDLSGVKNMMCHIDYTNSFASTYEWTLSGGLKFIEYYEARRSSKMY